MHALGERRELLAELRQIVQAMKNLAFAELQRVGRVLPSQAQARDAVRQGLASLPEDGAAFGPAPRLAAWLVIGAERGLCGAFNARLAQEVSSLRQQDPAPAVLVASHRLAENLVALPGIEAVPGCAGLEEADDVLDAWVARILAATADGGEAWLLATRESGLVRRRLWPWQPEAATGARTDAPLRLLALPDLAAALKRQWLRLELQGALLASLQDENRWRLAQMQRAQDHLDELAGTLRQQLARLRQADITNELETLVASQPGTGVPGPSTFATFRPSP
jgi:F-type H+-transporting ATPase subunit gamma